MNDVVGDNACSDDEDTADGYDVISMISTLLQNASHNVLNMILLSVQNGRVRIAKECRPLVWVLILLRTDQSRYVFRACSRLLNTIGALIIRVGFLGYFILWS